MKIGIDIGGSHIGIGLVDEFGNIQQKKEKYIVEKIENESQINKQNLKEEITQFIIQTIKEYQKMDFVENVGIAVPGTIKKEQILKSVNLGVKEYNLVENLKKEIQLPIKIRNDAKCAALTENTIGALKDYKRSLFLTLGTGIGGAFIYHGTLMKSDCTEGYEIGHVIIKSDGLQCRCGKRGCFETYGGILAFKNKVIDRLNLSHDIPGPELRKIIDSSMDKISDIIEEYINDLAIGISNLINIFEPDCIVIGGGFARYDYMLLGKLKGRLLNSNLLFNKRDDIVLRVAEFGNDAGIIGASQL